MDGFGRNENTNYNFCKKCGALTKEGVCQSCGHRSRGANRKQMIPQNAQSYNTNTQGGQTQNAQSYNTNTQGGQTQNEQSYNTNTQGGQYQQYAGMGPNQIPIGNKKKRMGPMAILAIVFAVLVTLSGFFVAVYRMVENVGAMPEYAFRNYDYYGDGYYDDDYYDYYGDDYYDDDYYDYYGDDYYGDDYYGDDYYGDDYYGDDYYDDYYDDADLHKNHTKEELLREAYYPSVCDCIDYSVSYDIDRESEITVSDVDETEYFFDIEYITLSGDIPNLEQLNNEIKRQAFLSQEEFFEEDNDIAVYSDTKAYVTYNDEEKISIVFDKHYITSENTIEIEKIGLHAINIDLESGMIMTNTAILDVTDTFSAGFKQRSVKQNGDIYQFDGYSEEAVTEFLKDEESIIIFYTPFGLEVGLNYMDSSGAGWVTVTYDDYEDYLKQY